MEQDQKAGRLPKVVTTLRPETGEGGKTTPGAVGESQGRSALLGAVQTKFDPNAVETSGSKDINAAGADATVFGNVDGKTVIWAADNKDVTDPKPSIVDACKLKNKYVAEALNSGSETDYPEPAASNMATGPRLSTFQPDDTLGTDGDRSGFAPVPGGHTNQYDAMIEHLATEIPAQQDAGFINSVVTTTNKPFSASGARKLEEQGIQAMHVEDSSASSAAATTPAVTEATTDYTSILPPFQEAKEPILPPMQPEAPPILPPAASADVTPPPAPEPMPSVSPGPAPDL